MARENYSPARRIATKIASGRNFKFIIACAALAAIVSGGIAIGSVMSRRLSSGEVKMKNYADSEVLNLSRLSWAAYKKTDTGDYSAAAECIDPGRTASRYWTMTRTKKSSFRSARKRA